MSEKPFPVFLAEVAASIPWHLPHPSHAPSCAISIFSRVPFSKTISAIDLNNVGCLPNPTPQLESKLHEGRYCITRALNNGCYLPDAQWSLVKLMWVALSAHPSLPSSPSSNSSFKTSSEITSSKKSSQYSQKLPSSLHHLPSSMRIFIKLYSHCLSPTLDPGFLCLTPASLHSPTHLATQQ